MRALVQRQGRGEMSQGPVSARVGNTKPERQASRSQEGAEAVHRAKRNTVVQGEESSPDRQGQGREEPGMQSGRRMWNGGL